MLAITTLALFITFSYFAFFVTDIPNSPHYYFKSSDIPYQM